MTRAALGRDPEALSEIESIALAPDWKCPGCSVMVFASKSECFKCHTKKDGTKALWARRSLPC